MTLAFECGVCITVESLGDRMKAWLQIPASLRQGYLTGLLGNYDSDPSNDLDMSQTPQEMFNSLEARKYQQ